MFKVKRKTKDKYSLMKQEDTEEMMKGNSHITVSMEN